MKNLIYKTTLPLFAIFALSTSVFAQNPPPALFEQPCPGSSSAVRLQGNLQIDGSPAVEGEDYVAFFDNDGFVIGTAGIQEFSAADAGCPNDISFLNIQIFGDAADQNDPTCPEDWGANEGEVLQGLVYDGSAERFYESFSYTYSNNDGTTEIMSGMFCEPVNSTVLPAVLTAFRGQVAGPKHIQLTWDVAREENVSHYEVQRSANGREWSILGDVTAAGDSETALNYDFDDLDPEGLRQFYRLRMVDLDGTDEFSGIVITELDQTGERTVNTFPNPASPATRLSIQLGGEWSPNIPIKASLYDLNGRVLTDYNALQAGTSSVAIPSGAKAGLYLLRVTQADAVFTHKISLQ